MRISRVTREDRIGSLTLPRRFHQAIADGETDKRGGGREPQRDGKTNQIPCIYVFRPEPTMTQIFIFSACRLGAAKTIAANMRTG